MKRRALLIQNPGKVGDANYVPTVAEAYNRFKSYLQSPVGGCWKDDELIELQRLGPMGLWLQSDFVFKLRELNQPDVDYSMIVFIGHGGAINGVDNVQLEDGELIPISYFTEIGNPKKRTVIIDACRKYEPLGAAGIVFEQREFSGDGGYDADACRDYYNDLISHAKPHVELLQSTQFDQYAMGSKDGTAFTDALFHVLNDGHRVWKQQALMDKYGECHKSIPDILTEINANMATDQQVPQYTNDSDDVFPFYAIKRPTTRIIPGGEFIQVLND